MADFHCLLMQTIAGLPNSTTETRRGLYQRARRVLLRQLHDARPPFAPKHIERELSAFDKAVAEIVVHLAVGKLSPSDSGDAASSIGDDQAVRSPLPAAVAATPYDQAAKRADRRASSSNPSAHV